ncbi:MAG: YwaF family protein [Clostridia bacterium]|nr:YwaF family protein [Clostridia bacterium]
MWSKELAIVSIPLHFIMLGLALAIMLPLRHKSEKTRRIPINILTIVFLVMEVGKQIEEIRSGDYSLWAIPLHFCSFFMFWPLFSLFGRGKVRKFGDVITFLFSAIIFFLMLIGPDLIYGGAVRNFYYNGVVEHSLVFHELVIFCFFLYLFSGIVEFKKEYWVFIPIAMTAYACIVVPFAYLLNTNYCSVLYMAGDNLLETIRVNTNQFVYNALQFVLSLGVMSLFYFIGVWITNAKNRKIAVNKSDEKNPTA